MWIRLRLEVTTPLCFESRHRRLRERPLTRPLPSGWSQGSRSLRSSDRRGSQDIGSNVIDAALVEEFEAELRSYDEPEWKSQARREIARQEEAERREAGR